MHRVAGEGAPPSSAAPTRGGACAGHAQGEDTSPAQHVVLVQFHWKTPTSKFLNTLVEWEFYFIARLFKEASL